MKKRFTNRARHDAVLKSMNLNSDSDECQGGESIADAITPRGVLCLSMPPLLAPQFFIGCESPKDAWVNNLTSKEKDIGREHCKEGVQRY